MVPTLADPRTKSPNYIRATTPNSSYRAAFIVRSGNFHDDRDSLLEWDLEDIEMDPNSFRISGSKTASFLE